MLIDLTNLGFFCAFDADQIVRVAIEPGRDAESRENTGILRWLLGKQQALIRAAVPPKVLISLRGEPLPHVLRMDDGPRLAKLADARTIYEAILACRKTGRITVPANPAQTIEAGTAETPQVAPCEARERDPEGDAPNE